MNARSALLGALMVMVTTAAVAQETSVSDVILTPRRAVQGEALTVSYELIAVGEDVSATIFLLPGAVDRAPGDWADTAVRATPKYQVTHEALTGDPQRCRATVPGGRTAAMDPGLWTAFSAVTGAGEGWEYFRLGEIEVRDASLVPLPERDGPPSVAILADALPTSGATSDPARVAELVRRADCAATLVSAANLADPSTFSRERFDLLVLPAGGAVPEAATGAIAQFTSQAGALISLGGPALTQIAPAAGATGGRTLTVADFEDEGALEPLDTTRGATSEGQLSIAEDGADGTSHSLKLSIDRLNDWLYVDLPLGDVAGDAPGYLEFHARGDAAAEALCLELIERDGSRWKYFVELDPRWRAYSVRMSDFAFYHGEDRGGPSDRFDPAEAETLKLGFYRALHRDQPGALWIDQVRLTSVARHPRQPRHEHLEQWGEQYDHLRARPWLDALGVFRDMRRDEGATRLRPADGQALFDAPIDLAAPSVAWEMLPEDLSWRGSEWDGDSGEVARYVPLLSAHAEDGRRLGDVAGMALHHHGHYRGAALAWLGVGGADLLDGSHPAIDEGCVRLVRMLTRGAYLVRPRPEFEAADGAVAQRWTVEAFNRGAPRTVTVRIEPIDGTPVEQTLELERGRLTPISLDAPATQIDMRRFGAEFTLIAAGERVDDMRAVADAREALRRMGEWALARQRPDAHFSRYYYADVYCARALRALAEFTGDDRYRQSALALLDAMVAEQRPDGGWWVGYGVPRQLVFVADDGCIALGLVQMAPYVDDARREAYLRAARKHIDFRESFRITGEVAADLRERYGEDHPGVVEGGLGIGWVVRDYFGDAPPTPEPWREMRQRVWVLHSSLAFLGGLCALGASDRACDLATRDTRWFLERIDEGSDSLTGGYANEAAVWMHDTLEDDALRTRLREHLTGNFFTMVAEREDAWWLESMARRSLMLPGLAYCARNFDASPEVRAGMARVLWGIAGDASATSLPNVLERNRTTDTAGVIMYAGFGAIGLAEVIEPRSTMLPGGG